MSSAVKQGRLTFADAQRKLFDPVAAAAQFEANRKRRPRVPAAAKAAQSERSASALQAARLRRELAEAELAETRAAEQRGDLVSRNEATAAYFAYTRIARNVLLNLPTRWATLLAGLADERDIRRILDQGIYETLNALAEGPRGPVAPAWAELAALALRVRAGDDEAALELGRLAAEVFNRWTDAA